ncbi:MAG: penicillin-binding protein 2 [Alphaproteobacteria bacterium]|nr:penicillin-binding protein 2 [Alphaproteobacteria bacterium]
MRKRLPPMAKNLASKSFSALTHHLSLWHQVVRDHSILDRARNRIVVGVMLFSVAFLFIGLRLFDVMIFRSSGERQQINTDKQNELNLRRADIVDRHGEILATHLITASVYANPKVILNAKEAAEKLCALIPDLNFDETLKRLSSQKGFVWIARHVTPKLEQAINHLGIPGVYLEKDQRRVYPYGSMVSHVLGYCGIDNTGLSGVEKYFDVKLRQDKTPLVLSIDVKCQHVVHDVLKAAIDEFQALAGNAMLMDLETGELLSMVSLPDFDPNQPNQNVQAAIFNRNTSGVFEPGSTFKLINTAIALETGRIKLSTVYDARNPIKIGRFTITDWRPKHNGILTVADTVMHSSNIAAGKIALDYGLEWQRKYYARFGFYVKPKLEIPEIGAPIVNKNPTDATLISNSFGYAISVSPLHTFQTVAALINNGEFRHLTLLRQKMPVVGEPIVSKETSAGIRKVMRMVVTGGSGSRAEVPGYPVLGKTGSAHIVRGKRYHANDKTTSFLAAFPANAPRYLLMVMLDSPKGLKKTHGFSTGGWNACPTAGEMVARLAPMLGIAPNFDYKESTHSNIKMVNYDVSDE